MSGQKFYLKLKGLALVSIEFFFSNQICSPIYSNVRFLYKTSALFELFIDPPRIANKALVVEIQRQFISVHRLANSTAIVFAMVHSIGTFPPVWNVYIFACSVIYYAYLALLNRRKCKHVAAQTTPSPMLSIF